MTAAWQDSRANLAAHPVAWPMARAIRHLGPVVHVPGLGLVVNDALLSHEILSRDRDFTKNGEGSIAAVMTQAFGPRALANMDGEAHRQFRQRLGGLTDPSHGEAWLAASLSPFTDALERLRGGATVDVAHVARTLSGRLTFTLLGTTPNAPTADIDDRAREVHALGQRIASALQLTPLAGSRLAAVRQDQQRLLSFAHDAFQRPDLPEISLVARLKALDCTEEETRGVLSIFFVAGALTLGVAIPRMIALLVDTGQIAVLQHNPSLLNGAVDEAMRFICPVPATLRVAAHDTLLSGRRIRAGTRVVIVTANCARDSTLFPDGDRFDVARVHDARARYLWYGAGTHFCLGFSLAQRTLRHVVAAFTALPGTLRVVRRRAARNVLLPAWSTLELRLAGDAG
ncbi:MAG TPA: cytochrome P450 [Gemmatimonas sp.]|nr:cytochrome P450 [Gemmatimonas sp.]